MESKKHTHSIHWGSVGKLAVPIGIGLLLIFIWVFSAHGVFPARAATSTLYVDGANGSNGKGNNCQDGNNPCATIGYAINRAGSGDIIQVAEGTYTATLELTKTLTIRGGYTISDTNWLTDTGETVIDGNDAGRVFFIHDNDTTLENLTITRGNAPELECWGGGVWVTNGNYTIRNTIFKDNHCGGLEVNVDFGPVDAKIDDSIFMNNGGAINTYGGTLSLVNVLVVSNTDHLLVSQNDSQITVINSTFTDHASDVPPINIIDSGAVTVTNSILWNNGDIDNNCGISCTITYSIIGTGDASGEGNLSANPQFVDPDSGNYHLQAWSPAIDAGTATGAPDVDFEGDSRPQNDGYDMGADEFVGTPLKRLGYRYVATTGSDTSNPCLEPDNPCLTVGHALNLAEADESVLIAAGTYTENVELTKTLTIRGGYTISGTEWLTDTGETVIDGGGTGRVFFIHDNDTTLEYLTITGGKASDPDCWGGGMWVTNGDATIRHLAITDNQAGCAGGAIELNDDYGSASLTVEDSLIADNTVENGSGGAMNTNQNITARFTNVLITGNQSGVGGVFSLNGGGVTVMNSTIADNQADQAVLLWSGTLTMTNSIMYENALSLQGDPPCTDCFIVTYSNIQGGGTNSGNIDEDPMFVDAASGDYGLMYGSPCIDTGTDSGAPDYDLAGTERPLDGDGDGMKTTDMGAYEFLLYHLYLPYTLKDTGS